MDHRVLLVLLAICFVGTASLTGTSPLGAQTPEQPYLDWARPVFSAEEYVSRREALIDRLRESGGGIFLAVSADGDSHGETFRQLDDFWYFTGLEVPRSVLVIDADRRTVTVLAPSRDHRFERPPRTNDFPGRPLLTDQSIWQSVGLTAVADVDELESSLRGWQREGRALRINGGGPILPETEARPFVVPDPVASFIGYLRTLGLDPKSAFAAVAAVRSVKSVQEQDIMRRAATMTGEAIRRAAGEVEPDVDERTLEAAFEGACKRLGSQRIGFASIIKSGPNSLWPWRILSAHYDRRNRRMRSGELVIFDVGCELDGYVSDVGRPSPWTGPSRRSSRRPFA